MLFTKLLGNDTVKRQLQSMLSRGTLGQSLLFSGPEGVGKGCFAEEVAAELLAQGPHAERHRKKLAHGNHPDLHIYKPEGKLGMHSIDALRRFTEEVYLYPYEAPKKVFIIHDADRMAPAAANALLKTFEEPAKDAVIILLSSHAEGILPTILSRCRKVVFRPLAEEEVLSILAQRNVEGSHAQLFARLCEGSVALALQWAEGGLDPKRAKLLSILKSSPVSYVNLVQELRELSDALEQSRKDLETVLRRELMAAYPDPKAVTALQKAAIEKEVEGVATMRQLDAVNGMLDVLMTWFRDAHLLRSNGDRGLVYNLDCLSELEQAARSPQLPSMDRVEKAVEEMQLALARSSPLPASLEALCLKLDMSG